MASIASIFSQYGQWHLSYTSAVQYNTFEWFVFGKWHLNFLRYANYKISTAQHNTAQYSSVKWSVISIAKYHTQYKTVQHSIIQGVHYNTEHSWVEWSDISIGGKF